MRDSMDVFALIAQGQSLPGMVTNLLQRARPLVSGYDKARTIATFLAWAKDKSADEVNQSPEGLTGMRALPSVADALLATQGDPSEAGGTARDAIICEFAERMADAFLELRTPAAQYTRGCATESEQRQWAYARELQLKEIAGEPVDATR